jgi:Gas vesicle protein G
MLLVDDLLTLPFKGLYGLFQEICVMADRETGDEGYIQQKLLELQLLFEMDEIDEEKYVREAAVWEARLNAARGAESEDESAGETPRRGSQSA